MHVPSVRPAEERDLGELVRLHGLARRHVAAERGGAILLGREVRPEPVEESLLDDVRSDDRIVIIGSLGSAPVGLAVAELVALHDGSLVAHISELFVEPEARGVGVGNALMQHLAAWADERDCDGIGSTVLPGDRASKNFFEAHGLVARAIVVHRDLRS